MPTLQNILNLIDIYELERKIKFLAYFLVFSGYVEYLCNFIDTEILEFKSV